MLKKRDKHATVHAPSSILERVPGILRQLKKFTILEELEHSTSNCNERYFQKMEVEKALLAKLAR